MRIGHGYDVHQFGEGDHIILGGVKISCNRSLIAHSDGDVLLHALCDALLGAAGLGDIGMHFPDTESRYHNIDSRQLLKHVNQLLSQHHYQLSNADMTIVAQAPKMQPHISAMRANIADDLAVAEHQINIKATTTEKLGFVGRREGIAAHAVVLLQSVPD